ncbi:MAG: hypothetical protein U9Q19_02670 [Pseudomonadota bacterium]|nr:hypothetical protein [Pseudomonadota bacterium]
MPLANEPIDLVINEGARFYQKFTWRDKQSLQPIDLTNYMADMQVRETANSDTALLTLSTEVITKDGTITLGGQTGTIEFEILASVLSTLGWRNATYDLLVYTDADHKDVLFGGRIRVEKINTRV